MPRAMTVCSFPTCPIPVPRGRCPEHARAADRARGTRQARGYDAAHDRERRRWAALVSTGTIPCARCGLTLQAGQPFELDHADHDRTRHLGPSHPTCNASAAGKASHHDDRTRQ